MPDPLTRKAWTEPTWISIGDPTALRLEALPPLPPPPNPQGLKRAATLPCRMLPIRTRTGDTSSSWRLAAAPAPMAAVGLLTTGVTMRIRPLRLLLLLLLPLAPLLPKEERLKQRRRKVARNLASIMETETRLAELGTRRSPRNKASAVCVFLIISLGCPDA